MATRRPCLALMLLLSLPATARADRHWWDISISGTGSKTSKPPNENGAAKTYGSSVTDGSDGKFVLGEHYSSSISVPGTGKRVRYVAEVAYQSNAGVSRDTFLTGIRVALPYGSNPQAKTPAEIEAQRLRTASFVQVMIGEVRTTENGNTVSDRAFALGGGLEAPIVNGLQARLQLDLIGMSFPGRTQLFVRPTLGIVLRLEELHK